MAYTPRLPTEIWDDILFTTIIDDFLPNKNASLFEDLDLFGHPCKIYKRSKSIKTNLRLVCRLWNTIIQRLKDPLLFLDSGDDKVESIDYVSNTRVDTVYKWSSYCRQWPCTLTRRKGGRCPPGKYARFPFPSSMKEENSQPVSIRLRVLRVLDYILYFNENMSYRHLEALSIPHMTFDMHWIPELMVAMDHISHLQLDDVRAWTDVPHLVLELPSLVYLKLDFDIWSEDENTLVKLDIHMPRVKTINLDGEITQDSADLMQRMIFSAKDTLVNLLLGYAVEGGGNPFPLERIVDFPHLKTLGVYLGFLPCPSNATAFAPESIPMLASSPLSLILLRLDDHDRTCSLDRKVYAQEFVHCFSKIRNWFSNIIVPFEWKDLEDLWGQSCMMFDREDSFNKDDPLPCLWSSLDYISQHQSLPIVDRNQVPLSEGDGEVFRKRMNMFMESETYKEGRRVYVFNVAKRKASGEFNHYHELWREDCWQY